jgi:hypothetical protein
MNNEKHSEREAFEKSIARVSNYPLQLDEDGEYDCSETFHAHRGWQAAIASRASKPVGVDDVVRAAQNCAHQLREAMMHLTSQDRDFWQRGDNAIMQEFEEAISRVQQTIASLAHPAHPAPQDVGKLVEAATELQLFLRKYANEGGALSISTDNAFTANGYASKHLALTAALAPFQQATGGE